MSILEIDLILKKVFKISSQLFMKWNLFSKNNVYSVESHSFLKVK